MDDIDEKHQMPSLTKHMPQLQSVSGGSTMPKLCLNGLAWFSHVYPMFSLLGLRTQKQIAHSRGPESPVALVVISLDGQLKVRSLAHDLVHDPNLGIV
jgi:hypothetical protein